MDEAFFSIIIPTYNSGNHLEMCLNSIISQNYPHKEIIIIDGNSTDKTLEIIKNYQKFHLHLTYFSGKDKGIYDAMNIGITKAKGNWFYFLGSDDTLYDKNVLATVNSHFKLHKKSKLFYGNVLTSDNYIQKYQRHNYKKLIKLNICHQAIFYHSSLFKKLSYDLNYTICSDWDFNLKVFRKKNYPIYINEIIAKYSLDGASKNWKTHPDYLNNFHKVKMALRYRSPLYFLFLVASDTVRNIKNSTINTIKWIFQ